jgi:hypothetical protein
MSGQPDDIVKAIEAWTGRSTFHPMKDFFIRRIGALYAHKIGQWLATLITLAIVRAAAYAVAKYPPLSPFINTPGLVESAMGIAAAVINTLANTASKTNASEGDVLNDVADDLKTEQPVVKAEPAQ